MLDCIVRSINLSRFNYCKQFEKGAGKDMIITSTNFKDRGMIQSKHTCDGDNVSPSLNWSDVPAGTRSLALIVDDPDAPDPGNPKMTWVHWVLYNIPTSSNMLSEGITQLPKGTLEGMNDWKRTGYGGPCPPIGRHRYFHKLYALDIVLPDLQKPIKAKLEKAMEGHIIYRAEIVGMYERGK
jgi:Raf kinase inhibitor-like YbhB/YbcL family protein